MSRRTSIVSNYVELNEETKQFLTSLYAIVFGLKFDYGTLTVGLQLGGEGVIFFLMNLLLGLN